MATREALTVNRLRLIIRDDDVDNQLFTDEQLNTFIDMAVPNRPYSAIAIALNAAAADVSTKLGNITVLGITGDGPSIAADLRTQARAWYSNAPTSSLSGIASSSSTGNTPTGGSGLSPEQLAKFNRIEDSATRDQTAGEIKDLLETLNEGERLGFEFIDDVPDWVSDDTTPIPANKLVFSDDDGSGNDGTARAAAAANAELIRRLQMGKLNSQTFNDYRDNVANPAIVEIIRDVPDSGFPSAAENLGKYVKSNDKIFWARNTVEPGHSRLITWVDYSDPNYREEVQDLPSPDTFRDGQFVYEISAHSFWIVETDLITSQKQWALHTPTGWNIHNVYPTEADAEDHVKAIGDIYDISGNIRRVSAYTPATEDELVPVWFRINVIPAEIEGHAAAIEANRAGVEANSRAIANLPTTSGEDNVQSSWLEQDTDSDAFIVGKPNIPTLRDAGETRDLLATLTGDDRLDASDIKNIPDPQIDTIAANREQLVYVNGSGVIDYSPLPFAQNLYVSPATVSAISAAAIEQDYVVSFFPSDRARVANRIVIQSGGQNVHSVNWTYPTSESDHQQFIKFPISSIVATNIANNARGSTFFLISLRFLNGSTLLEEQHVVIHSASLSTDGQSSSGGGLSKGALIATGLQTTGLFTLESAYSRILTGDNTNDIVFPFGSRLSVSGVVIESSAADGVVVDRLVWLLNMQTQGVLLFVNATNYFTLNLTVTNVARLARLTLAGTGGTGQFPRGANMKVYELEGFSF